MRPFLRAAAASVAAVLCAPGARADTRIEGEYQIQMDVRKQDRGFPWNYDYNQDESFGLVQFRMLSKPRPGVEAFLKFEEDWNGANNGGYRPEFQFRDGHVQFRQEKNGRELQAFLFSRQDRFWVDNHLIQVVQGGRLNEGGDAQGVRLEANGYLGTRFTYIFSDFSNQSFGPDPQGTDDGHVLRLQRDFLGGALGTGMTYARRIEGQEGEQGHNEVKAGDVRYRLGNTDIRVEYAQSKFHKVLRPAIEFPDRPPFPLVFTPGEGNEWRTPEGIGEYFQPEKYLPTNAYVRAEVRAVTVGVPKLGYLNIAPQYWFAGPDYENNLGDSLNDQRGFFINTWYLLPRKAITLTTNYAHWEQEIFSPKEFDELYVELYTEYSNGFTTKFFHRRRKTTDFAIPDEPRVTENNDVIGEVQVESRLAWMRVQGKIKDLDTIDQKELASLEAAVNLTGAAKLYTRFTLANDPARVREALFTEFQYRPRGGMEMFLSYGPWWIGDTPNPVEDGDLEGSGQNKDIVRFILKGYF